MATFQRFPALVYLLVFSSPVVVRTSNPSWCSRGSYSSSCDAGYICCSNKCLLGSDCYDEHCTSDSDCSLGEMCCNSQCKYASDCIGLPCSTKFDCRLQQHCCDGICSLDCDNTTAIVLGSVCGVIIIVCILSLFLYCACRRRQGHHGRVIVRQGVTTTTVRTTGNVPQAHPPYWGQIPPPYQQSYQYYPPPQYEQHQTAITPPYNPGTVVANDQPPPYSAATQGRSGVYTPKTSYGATEAKSVSQPVL